MKIDWLRGEQEPHPGDHETVPHASSSRYRAMFMQLTAVWIQNFLKRMSPLRGLTFACEALKIPAMCCIAPSLRVVLPAGELPHGLNHEDTLLLQALERAGQLAPGTPAERARFERLLRDGYLQRASPCATTESIASQWSCELSEQGKASLAYS